MHLVLWVTSECNLDCPLCNQRTTRQAHPEYEMSEKELHDFVTSCQRRKIHFSTIELTGGEPTLWPIFDKAIGFLQASGITDAVTFITNGRNPKNTAETANRHGLCYVVSRSQCSENQAAIHKATGVGVVWNNAEHRLPPKAPLGGTLPALCSQRQDMNGRVIRQLFYLRGTVWYCCMAHANSRIMGDNPDYFCPFEDNFDEVFYSRRDDLPICRVCLCNKSVWDRLGSGASNENCPDLPK